MLIANANVEGLKEYFHIYRTDTNDYKEADILAEIREWQSILCRYCKASPDFYIENIIINSRFSATLACAGRRKNSSSGYVKVNARYLYTHSNSDNFHCTLAHEAIHTMTGCFNHGPNFKAMGLRLKNLFENLNIQRTGGDPGYNKYMIENNKYNKEEKDKWLIECQKCGGRIYRKRSSDATLHPEHYHCSRCGGKFKVFQIMPDGSLNQYIKIAI